MCAPIFTFKTCSMKYILKNHLREPQSLRIFRSTTPNASYNGLHGKVRSEIRDSLAEEQGYICAYCMRRIMSNEKDMEIEHYISQNIHPGSPYSLKEHQDGRLKYINMLGTCNGIRSCSGIRKNEPLVINPTQLSCERLVKFRTDGTAYSDDDRIEKDIQTLELYSLSEARKIVIDKAREEAKKHKDWNNEMLEAEIEKWKTLKRTRYGLGYEEYCMAAVHYLESKKSRKTK